ncbi:uncharacterized protein MONBRDRAFT_35147 [Monosiga brevicollis MX1]|uniref:CYRIA/CYRIB Rac1 binding domain-containing protein n=1 Tax=Monosiga brevicollis TaxID=81824 RepID=A9UXH2_MONBE|nr:uncharacterized protein MONBRDRAFT_35147 [Monosiga brevicollis MX1]EDQ90006.1 predicted protein [Monosiga brevicollis MX1]|eukprot:XP_001745428.1 hypothetical protein [Monosiga brevicollis MX1]
MGNIVQVLRRDAQTLDKDIFVDFEKASPSDAELETYEKVNAVLSKADGILKDLETYEGAGDPIRKAISNGSDEELQKQAWDAVSPLVALLKDFYIFSSEVESVLPFLLEALCTEAPATEALEGKQALAKQFAEILQFVLKFDDLKMNNPAVQNDFSYYRRTISRMKMKNPGEEEEAVVSNEEANRMSLFYAYPTPMLKTVSDATTKFVSENHEIPVENTTDFLATLATICRVMIESPDIYSRFEKPDTVTFCQRVMVGAIILYDHVHLVGAFSKKNQSIDIRASLKALKMHENPHLENLLNALRFSTKHLSDDSTPKDIKKLLNV